MIGRRLLPRERFVQGPVVAVDVAHEVHDALRVDVHGVVEDHDPQALAKVHLRGAIALHGPVDPLASPARIVPQHPLGQAGRVLEADAAVAEVPPGPREELLRGRAVHVDVLGVGKDELGQAQ